MHPSRCRRSLYTDGSGLPGFPDLHFPVPVPRVRRSSDWREKCCHDAGQLQRQASWFSVLPLQQITGSGSREHETQLPVRTEVLLAQMGRHNRRNRERAGYRNRRQIVSKFPDFPGPVLHQGEGPCPASRAVFDQEGKQLQ